MYLHLNVSQTRSESSLHRMARVAKLPLPKNGIDIRQILGDQGDVHYPIFHDDLSEHAGDLTHSRTVSTGWWHPFLDHTFPVLFLSLCLLVNSVI
jgi:hypothetical protein